MANHEFDIQVSMDYASQMRNSESGEGGGSTNLGLLDNPDAVQSLKAAEKNFMLSAIAGLIGIKNVEQASLFQAFNFLQNVFAGFNLGNLSPFNISKIATGLFSSKGGNQK